jgi:hypothetical protein
MPEDLDVGHAITDEFDDDFDDQEAVEDVNGRTISIRRATGEEVLTIWSPDEQWSVFLQPGGAMTNAFVGTPREPVVWVDGNGRQIERDHDGTYVIRID